MTGYEKILMTDIETFSPIDIGETGVYRYVEDDSFEVLLIAYAWGDGPVDIIDLWSLKHDADKNGPIITPEFVKYQAFKDALLDDSVLKVAHNCSFERTCLGKLLGEYLPPEQWADTMNLARMNGLPATLDGAGAALNLEAQKIKEGEALIRYFCKPCSPTISNKGRTRNLPIHSPDKWSRFKTYCKRDVEVEQKLYQLLSGFPIPDWEDDVRCLDARINEYGVMVDMDFVQSAVTVNDTMMKRYEDELRTITGLSNPNSISQLKSWLEQAGVYVESLNKASISDLLNDDSLSSDIKRVLTLRQLMGKTSVKKYETMILAASPNDSRIRGMTQYYGAGRTGRFSGRLVQLQNLPQNHLARIGDIREMVKDQDIEILDILFDSIPDTLSQLIRTALIAKPGHTFLVADYSAIEARTIAYLSGEQWRMDVFANGGDIYCSSASQMFHVPVVKHGINGHLRQKGKIAELACGYGGGVYALKAFGADKMGLSEEEMQTIVDQWRQASPTIPKFWRETETAAKNAILNPGRSFKIKCGVSYIRTKDALLCKLPSGRLLSYWDAHIDSDDRISFMGQNQVTRKWELANTWGGRLVENITQAVSRDVLAVAMLRLAEKGYNICFSVHDELIAEEPKDGRTWQEMADIMGQPIDWAPGLLLRADGYSTDFYMKD